MVELIITEKPAQAEKIALALANGKPKRKKTNSVNYYELKYKGKKIIVGCAVGHLYGLKKTKLAKGYPTFEVEWMPKHEIDKNSEFTKKYLDVLKDLAKKADKFTVATDYDREGSVIGYNIVRFVCGKKDARRMKFSTLTKDELIEAYEGANKHLEFSQIHAGETRHYLDWYYGINISNALMNAIKHATNRFRIMSTGRVQGPTLKLIVKKEEAIKKFKPTKYWEINLSGTVRKTKIFAKYKKGKILKKDIVNKVLKNTIKKPAKIIDLKKRKTKVQPPIPFDLTTLQTESYKVFKISPKETSQIAQKLYTSGMISYPRTSSQKLPKSIGYKKILKKLSKQKNISPICDKILAQKNAKPKEGKKSDPAHPAIYPTGEFSKLSGRNLKLYSLIVRRFLAVFGDVAEKESTVVTLDVNNEKFSFSGSRILKKGWYEYYKYALTKEIFLPMLEKGDEVKNLKINSDEKETQPPARYNQASIIKEMEDLNLGTKATRALILDALYQRKYIDGVRLEATALGMKLIQTLDKYSPEIIDEKLTKSFEEDMDKIREGKKKQKTVITAAKKVLITILKKFKENESKIGKKLLKATEGEDIFGTCPNCKKGSLGLRRGKFGPFIACDQYEKGCKTTIGLPKGVFLKPAKEICEKCKFPLGLIIRKARQPQKLCLNKDCSTKKPKQKPKSKKCQKCEEGKLIIRKSVYGSFYACDRFPKCRYIFNPGKKK